MASVHRAAKSGDENESLGDSAHAEDGAIAAMDPPPVAAGRRAVAWHSSTPPEAGRGASSDRELDAAAARDRCASASNDNSQGGEDGAIRPRRDPNEEEGDADDGITHVQAAEDDGGDDGDAQIIIIGGWLGSGPLAASDMWVLDISGGLDQLCWFQPVQYEPALLRATRDSSCLLLCTPAKQHGHTPIFVVVAFLDGPGGRPLARLAA